jgi:hypothetical protein
MKPAIEMKHPVPKEKREREKEKGTRNRIKIQRDLKVDQAYLGQFQEPIEVEASASFPAIILV